MTPIRHPDSHSCWQPEAPSWEYLLPWESKGQQCDEFLHLLSGLDQDAAFDLFMAAIDDCEDAKRVIEGCHEPTIRSVVYSEITKLWYLNLEFSCPFGLGAGHLMLRPPSETRRLDSGELLRIGIPNSLANFMMVFGRAATNMYMANGLFCGLDEIKQWTAERLDLTFPDGCFAPIAGAFEIYCAPSGDSLLFHPQSGYFWVDWGSLGEVRKVGDSRIDTLVNLLINQFRRNWVIDDNRPRTFVNWPFDAYPKY